MRKYAKIFSIILLIALVSCSGNTEKTENELTAPFLSIEKTQTGEWQICITPDENAKALTIPGNIKTENGTPVTVFGGFGANKGGFGTNTGGFGSSTGGFGSNTGGFGSNTGGFGSNTGGFGSNNTGGFGSNTGGFGNNKGGFGFGNTGGFGSNTGGFGTNTGGFGSNTGGFGTNTGGFGSNTGGFGFNNTGGFGANANPSAPGHNPDEIKKQIISAPYSTVNTLLDKINQFDKNVKQKTPAAILPKQVTESLHTSPSTAALFSVPSFMLGKQSSALSFAEKEVEKNQEVEELLQKEIAASSETEKADEVAEAEPETAAFEKPELEIPIEDVATRRLVLCRQWFASTWTPQSAS